jgi:hypothetical protein
MFSHADSFAGSPAAARPHARPCALLLWCSGHSLLLSFLRLFLWHRPARLFCSLFAHGHLGGIMKLLGLFPFTRSTLPHSAEHKSRSYPKYVVLSRSLRSLPADDGARSLRSLLLMMCVYLRSLRSLCFGRFAPSLPILRIASLAPCR